MFALECMNTELQKSCEVEQVQEDLMDLLTPATCSGSHLDLQHQMMVQVLVHLPVTWETQMKLHDALLQLPTTLEGQQVWT